MHWYQWTLVGIAAAVIIIVVGIYLYLRYGNPNNLA
jgi:hypothetical protein